METTTIDQLRDKCLQWLAAVAGDGAKLDAAEARIRELFDAHLSQPAERGLCERNPAPDAAAACVPSSATTAWPSESEKLAERGEATTKPDGKCPMCDAPITIYKDPRDGRGDVYEYCQPPAAERGEAVAWAWKSDGMTGWALGHCKPTPDNTHKFHERNTVVRPLVFGDTAPSPAAGVPDDAEAVSACLGDDAAAMLEANSEDERALNMQRAAQIIEAMLSAAPEADHG